MASSKVQVRDRDRLIFQAIYSCQTLTTPQISARFFPPETRDANRDVRSNESVSAGCRRRLKQLYEAKYLSRREIPTTYKEGKKPYAYSLTKRSLEIVAEELGVSVGDLDWRPEYSEIKTGKQAHLIAINDVRFSIGIDAEERGFTITEWLIERKLKRMKLKAYIPDSSGRKRKTAFEPDGYFCLFIPNEREGGGHTYPNFIEVDRGTEHIGTSSYKDFRNYFKNKIPPYLSFYRSGDYERVFGFEHMRVLFITTDQQRLDKMKAVTEELNGGSQFWFTTIDEITAPESALTKRIWKVAGQEEAYPLVW